VWWSKAVHVIASTWKEKKKKMKELRTTVPFDSTILQAPPPFIHYLPIAPP
jgi:hypothetical protein